MTKMDKNKRHGLTARQISAIPHLVASSSYEKGCKNARISRNTFYEWLKDTSFKEELKRQRDVVVEEALEALKSSMTTAVKALLKLLETTKNEYLRRSLAKDVINYVVKTKELDDLVKRIEMIEARISELSDR